MAQLPTRFANKPGMTQGPSARNVPLIEQPGSADLGEVLQSAGKTTQQRARFVEETAPGKLVNLEAIQSANNALLEAENNARDSKDPSEWLGEFDGAVAEQQALWGGDEEGYQKWVNSQNDKRRKLNTDARAVQANNLVTGYFQGADIAAERILAQDQPAPTLADTLASLVLLTGSMDEDRKLQALGAEEMESAQKTIGSKIITAHIARLQQDGKPVVVTDALGNTIPLLDSELRDYLTTSERISLQSSIDTNNRKSARRGRDILEGTLNVTLNTPTDAESTATSLLQQTSLAGYSGFPEDVVRSTGSPMRTLVDLGIRTLRSQTTALTTKSHVTEDDYKKLNRLKRIFGDSLLPQFRLAVADPRLMLDESSVTELEAELAKVDQQIQKYSTARNQKNEELRVLGTDTEQITSGDKGLSPSASQEAYETVSDSLKLQIFDAGLQHENVSLQGSDLIFAGLAGGEKVDLAYDGLEVIRNRAAVLGIEPMDFISRQGNNLVFGTNQSANLIAFDYFQQDRPDVYRERMRDPVYRDLRVQAIAYAQVVFSTEAEIEEAFGRLGGSLEEAIGDKFRDPETNKIRRRGLSDDFILTSGKASGFNRDGGVSSNKSYEFNNTAVRARMRLRLVDMLTDQGQGVTLDFNTLGNLTSFTQTQFEQRDMVLIEVDRVMGSEGEFEPLFVSPKSSLRSADGAIDGETVSELAVKINDSDATGLPFNQYLATDVDVDFDRILYKPREPGENTDAETFYIPMFDRTDPNFGTQFIRVDVDRTQPVGSRISIKKEDATFAPPSTFAPYGVPASRPYAPATPEEPLTSQHVRLYVRDIKKEFPGVDDATLRSILEQRIKFDGWKNYEDDEEQ